MSDALADEVERLTKERDGLYEKVRRVRAVVDDPRMDPFALPHDVRAALAGEQDQRSDMTTLTEFLTARLDATESAARAAQADAMDGHLWKHWPREAHETVQRLVLNYTREVRAEVEAKRKIVAIYASFIADPPASELSQALCFLALPYADHPDYEESWRP